MDYINIKKGARFDIYAVVVKDVCPYKDYVEALGRKDKTQIATRIRFIAERGTDDQEKLKFLRDGIHEVRTRSGIRIFCFISQNRMLLLTHGRRKPGPKVLENEIDKALTIKNKFMDDQRKKQNREIKLEEE